MYPYLSDFNAVFSIPRAPQTLLTPGQYFELDVPTGKKVLITDVYVENQGGGISACLILEQRGPESFEIRYMFRTVANQSTIINFTTGLKLGDETPIAGSIRIQNSEGSLANILPRVNGVFVG